MGGTRWPQWQLPNLYLLLGRWKSARPQADGIVRCQVDDRTETDVLPHSLFAQVAARLTEQLGAAVSPFEVQLGVVLQGDRDAAVQLNSLGRDVAECFRAMFGRGAPCGEQC